MIRGADVDLKVVGTQLVGSWRLVRLWEQPRGKERGWWETGTGTGGMCWEGAGRPVGGPQSGEEPGVQGGAGFRKGDIREQ